MSAALKPRRELSLYERAQRLAEIDARIEAAAAANPDGEIPPELADEWDRALAGFANTGEAIAQYIVATELEAHNATAEATRLNELAAKRTARADRRRATLKAWMEDRGIDAIKSDLFDKIAIEPASPKTAIAEGVTPESVNEAGWCDYVRMVPLVPAHLEFDRKAMLAAHRAGKTLPPGLGIETGTKLIIK